MNARFTMMAVLSCLLLFSFIAEAEDTGQGEFGDKQGYSEEDVDKALDKAIKALTVIKEEINDNEKDTSVTKGAGDDSNREDSAVAAAGKWISRVNRIWKNVKKAVSDDAVASHDEDDVIDTRKLSEKIGQAIEMMATIKSELEEETRTREDKNASK